MLCSLLFLSLSLSLLRCVRFSFAGHPRQSDLVKCRFFEENGDVLTLSAYTTDDRFFVRLQKTYAYSDDGLEIGEGVDLPVDEWRAIKEIWPQIIFCLRFNMKRKFELCGSKDSWVKIEVLKNRSSMTSLHITGYHILYEQGEPARYLLSGEVYLSRFTVLECREVFKYVEDVLLVHEQKTTSHVEQMHS